MNRCEKEFQKIIGNKALLTNGFTKKTDKIPKSELALAKKYRADYERRH